MERKKWTGYTLLILFAVFIWGYSLVDLLAPNREYSEMENRYLAQAPKFTFASLINNTYALKMEEFTNDQFMLRDGWITLKSICETALLKIENNGIVYGKDHYMFEKRLSLDDEQLKKNTESLSAFAEKFPGNNMTLMLAPTSDMVLADKMPRGLHNVDQKPLIKDIYDIAGEKGVRSVDVFGLVSGNSRIPAETPLFYRTDHHWTTEGAHIAYEEYMALLGFEPKPLSSLTPQSVPDFYGTFFSKAKLFNAVSDTIEWYDVPVKSVTVNGEPVDGLYDTPKWDTRDKYAAFIHSNNGVTVIESDCNQNSAGDKTSRVLVFKDSFGNSFAPFLCYNFDEVTVVDLRYYTEVEKLMQSHDYDEILFLYSFPSFSRETSLVNLKL